MTEQTAESGALRAGALRDFARSSLFERTFQDGMSLVEDTAAYLDGAGRKESRLLGKTSALAYAGESMRLTTQLMQVASWLLVQRAVREGDMAPIEACQSRYRLDADAKPAAEPDATDEDIADHDADRADDLPPGLLGLRERTSRLYDRVRHLDQRMYCVAWVEEDAAHPVLAQFARVRAAFNAA